MGPFGNSHISEDLTQPERANEVAYEASAHIRKWRLPATPKCFELFFNYISGESPSLKIALDEMIQRGVLSANDVIALYRRFISAPDIDDRIKSIGVGLDDEIGKVADAIDDVAQFTRTSSAQVIDIRESLPKFKNADELKAFASELAQGVFEMRLVNSELEAKLRASRQEIDNLKKNLSLVQLEAQTDALTGLVNRKFLNVLLGKAFASFEATGNPLTLMMCDIDHFKAFNDKWGHLVGDQVLRLVGKTLLDCVKGKDIAGRYGGEEFAIVLPDTSGRPACTVAEQVRRAIMKNHVRNRRSGIDMGRVTLSIGIAEANATDTLATLLARADRCLYHAKKTGRNQVVIQDDLPSVFPEDPPIILSRNEQRARMVR